MKIQKIKYSKAPKPKELKANELRWKCDPDIFEFKSTFDLEPIEGILGQERALKALKTGVDLRSTGYNIYVSGLSGTGKSTTIKKILENISTNCPPLYDYAYVNNFKDGDRPILLMFQSGHAKQFRHDIENAIEILKKRIPLALDNEFFQSKRKSIIEQYNKEEQELLNPLNEKLKKENFTLGQTKIGEAARPDIFPIIDDQPVSIFKLDELVQQKKITKEQADDIIKKYSQFQEELHAIFKKGLIISQNFQEKLFKLEKEAAKTIVKGVLENLKEKYKNEKIEIYLSQVEDNILNNIPIFKGLKPEGNVTPTGYEIDYFKSYEVNVILDSTDFKKCPVIEETAPNYVNLFGTIEKITDGRGGWYSDFTRIKAGSLLRANGGYLIINVNYLFEEPMVWRTLKRVLTYSKLEIQDLPSVFFPSQSILKPEPIDINTKVILIGSEEIYSLLANYEYDFKKIFKIKADFDYEIKKNNNTLVDYARVIKKLIKDEDLCDFDKSAIAFLIELSARYVGSQNKLTTRFSYIADLAREADFWTKQSGKKIITAKFVEMAYENAKERHGLLESKINDMIQDGMFLIDTGNKRIGQVNGLAVYNADFYTFGRPTRITATYSLGTGNIINVEREAGMSGRTYNKGVLIIIGYFKETFGQETPLNFNANLVFEQSYGTIDGDSASCAEIFALLSTLSRIPIKQSIAVTGSLNQKGDVQPIGGVNEKIEGFYDICKMKGLNKHQGVIIPEQNVKDLMLKEDILKDVRKGNFHIYPIKRVEEGIQILTDVKSGSKTETGYEKGTVYYLVEQRIKELYTKAKKIRRSSQNPNKRK
jgi:lon-related putative ATP-dependent protease